MGGGLDMCFNVEATGSFLLGLPMNEFYTLAGAFPGLEKYVPPRDRQSIPQEVSLLTFLPSWWLTYEKYVWYVTETSIHTSVVYCRLAGTPPSSSSVNP
jgi:hypothetical protein